MRFEPLVEHEWHWSCSLHKSCENGRRGVGSKDTFDIKEVATVKVGYLVVGHLQQPISTQFYVLVSISFLGNYSQHRPINLLVLDRCPSLIVGLMVR